MPVRLVVLASGNGSNLQALLDACAGGDVSARVVGVITNRPDAYALRRADAAGVAHQVLTPAPGEPRPDYDRRLADAVASFEPDWVILAGWMRILTVAFLGRFGSRTVNLHPALPGELPGTHAIERAYAEAQAGRRNHTGVMVHVVPDEGVDDGPVLAVADVPIYAADTLADLEARVHDTEHRLLVAAVAALCRHTTEEAPSP